MKTREISVKVSGESDLYSAFDPEQKLLSEDVSLHLARNYLNKHRAMNEKYIIHIYSDDPVDEAKLRERFHAHYAQEYDNIKFATQRLTIKQYSLFGFGILVLAIWVYFSAKAEGVNVELLSIVGSLSIWEGASILLMQRPDMIRMLRTLQQAMNADIIVHNKS